MTGALRGGRSRTVPTPFPCRMRARSLVQRLSLLVLAAPALGQRSAWAQRPDSAVTPAPARIVTGRTVLLAALATAGTVVLTHADERIARGLARDAGQRPRVYGNVADAASYV